MDKNIVSNLKKPKLILRSSSKITEDSITIYGAGKFRESKLVLDKTEAMLLYIELHKFIMEK